MAKKSGQKTVEKAIEAGEKLPVVTIKMASLEAGPESGMVLPVVSVETNLRDDFTVIFLLATAIQQISASPGKFHEADLNFDSSEDLGSLTWRSDFRKNG